MTFYRGLSGRIPLQSLRTGRVGSPARPPASRRASWSAIAIDHGNATRLFWERPASSATGAVRISSNTPCWWRWSVPSRQRRLQRLNPLSAPPTRAGIPATRSLAASNPARAHRLLPVPLPIPLMSQFALVVAALAAAFDLSTSHIPNILTLGGALGACLLQVVDPTAPAAWVSRSSAG